MKYTWRKAVLVSLLVFLSACETFPISEKKPLDVASGDAVLLVGLISGEKAMLFNEEHEVGPYWLRHFLRPETPFREANVYAFSHPVGKSFKVKRIAIPGGYTFQEAILSNAPSLIPEKAGIYYYGTIMHSFGTVSINDREKPQMLILAREKYKNIFERLPLVNFK